MNMRKYSLLFASLFLACIYGCKIHTKVFFDLNNNKVINYYSKNLLLKTEEYTPENELLKLTEYYYFYCENCKTEIIYLNRDNQVFTDQFGYETIIKEMTFYSNGNKKTLRFKYNNSNYSLFYEWYESGALQCTGAFGIIDSEKNNVLNENNTNGIILVTPIENIKNGIWRYYKNNGELELVEFYYNGNLISLLNDTIELDLFITPK